MLRILLHIIIWGKTTEAYLWLFRNCWKFCPNPKTKYIELFFFRDYLLIFLLFLFFLVSQDRVPVTLIVLSTDSTFCSLLGSLAIVSKIQSFKAIFVCVCSVCTCCCGFVQLCVQVCTHVCTWRLISGVFLSYSILCFEIRTLAEPGANSFG